MLIYTNKRHPLVFELHRIWAWLFFNLSFIPIKKIYSDNALSAKVGDTVKVRETRPTSKLKRFTTVEIIKKSL